MLSIDKNGFPVLLEDTLELDSFVPTKTGQGNPFHSSTGRFSFAPPGTHIIIGSNLIKGLSTSARRLLFDRVKIGQANQIAARIIDGKLAIALLKDGRRIDSFSIAPVAERKGTSQTEFSDQEKEWILEAARDLSLQGKALEGFVEGKLGVKLDDAQKKELHDEIDRQRLEDLINYLHQNLLRTVRGDKQATKIRLQTPRGYLRKSFSNIDEAKTRIIIQRLEGKGWSRQELDNHVISTLPQRLKKSFAKGDKEAKVERKEERARQGKDV